MRVLITGGSGLLGQYLNESVSRNHEILSLYLENEGNCRRYNSVRSDIRDWGRMSLLFNNFRPDAVIHTACFSRPEICAVLSRDEVYRLNVEATEMIAQLSNDFHSRLIYTSTDLVYDGEADGMLREDADLNPLSLYAESKLMGEISIQNYSNNYIILRTALLIGFGITHARNNFHYTYEKLKDGNEVNLFKDQYRTPLSLFEATEFIEKLLSMNVKNEVINFGGAERVSRLEIGRALCDVCGFDKNLVKEISCRDAEGVPQVPDVSMNTEKLRALGLEQKTLHENVKHICAKGIM
jgi:dTDP-4-dehydrorhamnose reductase